MCGTRILKREANGDGPILASWAVLSAVFAALTAIFAKIGVEAVNPDVATFLRTLVIVAILGGILVATGGGRTRPTCRGGPSSSWSCPG